MNPGDGLQGLAELEHHVHELLHAIDIHPHVLQLVVLQPVSYTHLDVYKRQVPHPATYSWLLLVSAENSLLLHKKKPLFISIAL